MKFVREFRSNRICKFTENQLYTRETTISKTKKIVGHASSKILNINFYIA